MKPELEEQGEGEHPIWNPIPGKEYWLGNRYGLDGGKESIYAKYFGILDGRYIFFREKDGEILKYSSEIPAHAVYFPEDNAGPWTPAIPAELVRDVIKGHEKEYIKNRLAGKMFVI